MEFSLLQFLFYEKEPIQRSANRRYPSIVTKRADRSAHYSRTRYQRSYVLHVENQVYGLASL